MNFFKMAQPFPLVGSTRNAPAAAAALLDPADFTQYFIMEDAGLTLSGSDVTAFLDAGTAGNNCTNVFGTKNTQSGTLGAKKTMLGAAANDNWYRSAANADNVVAEGAGMFAFVIYPTSVAELKVLWALENSANGYIALIDDAGTKKVRVNFGTGGQEVQVDSTAITLDAWNTVIVRYSGVNVYVQVNNAAEQTAAGAGGDVLATRLAQRFQIFSNGGGNVFQGYAALACARNTFPDAAGVTLLKAEIAGSFPGCGL